MLLLIGSLFYLFFSNDILYFLSEGILARERIDLNGWKIIRKKFYLRDNGNKEAIALFI